MPSIALWNAFAISLINSMDPEQTFLRVHARLSGMLAQLLSPRLRGVLEHLCLVVAFLLLALLAVMHVNFVSQPGCAEELSHDNVAEAQLLQIKIVGNGLWSQKPFDGTTDDRYIQTQSASIGTTATGADGRASAWQSWLHWFGSSAWRNKVGKRILMNEEGNEIADEYSKMAAEGIIYKTAEIRTAVWQLWEHWTLYSATWLAKIGDAARRFAKFWRNAGRELIFSSSKDDSHAFSGKSIDHSLANWLEKRSEAFEPVYLYSVERGYLILPEGAKFQHNVLTVNISISARNLCFGNRWQQLLINGLVGYDTILMNSLLNARGEGYLYNYQTKELYDLNYPHESSRVPSTLEGYVVSKCGVLIMSLFVFFTTTMSVSFTLRETQARMLKFTVQLQYHARHRLPTFRLIFVHVIESLVFVPIMIGILFFLFEFYDDQLLAFMVLTLVWLCELFTMISVRTPVSMQYFPRYFFLYFMVFHIYFFSYEYGFSYLAFSTTAAFMQHLVLYFWNHFEVPALQRFLRARMLLQQQNGVQITSSAIITSTLHVTRLTPTGILTATGADSRSIGHNAVDENSRNRDVLGDIGRSGTVGNFNNNNTFSQVLPGGDGNHSRLNNFVYAGHRAVNDSNRVAMDSMARADNNLNRENEGISAGGLQQSFHPSMNSPLSQSNALNSFGSILLWILGGPSENLSAFPLSRDTNGENDHTQVGENTTTQTTFPEQAGGIPGLRHRARNMSDTNN